MKNCSNCANVDQESKYCRGCTVPELKGWREIPMTSGVGAETSFDLEKFNRKFPLEINKIQFHGNFDEIEKFVGGDAEFRNGKLLVATREGPLWASHGDWIVKDADGKFRVWVGTGTSETIKRYLREGNEK